MPNPFSRPQLQQMAVDAASRYGVSPGIFTQVIQRESNWDPNAVNPRSGAAGLGQFLASTWRQYGGGRSVYDPQANLDASARYISDLTRRNGGDLRAALQAYSGGAHYVDQILGPGPSNPAETGPVPAWMKTFLGPDYVGRNAQASQAPGQDHLTGLPARVHVEMLQPGTRDALNQAVGEGLSQGLDLRPWITSAGRTDAQQQGVYDKARAGKSPYPAALPGTSHHQFGEAIDIDVPRMKPEDRSLALGLLQKYGLVQQDPSRDPIHFELRPGSTGAARPDVPAWMQVFLGPDYRAGTPATPAPQPPAVPSLADLARQMQQNAQAVSARAGLSNEDFITAALGQTANGH